MFRFTEPSSGQFLKQSTFSECAHIIDLLSDVTFFNYFFLWRCDPTRAMASSFTRFLDHTQRSTTVGRTPLDEWSARRRVLYLKTHNTHNRQTFMPPVGFESTISVDKWELRLDYGRSPHAYVSQRLQIQLELLITSGMPLETCWAFNERWNNKFYYKVASCWLFLLSHTAMNGFTNIKKRN
jgi:hypothetical protein